MKSLYILCALFSFSVFAKRPTIDFTQALNQDFEKEIQEDDYKYKKEVTRLPASVQPEQERQIQETPKIDKNVRQIGPNNW